MSADQFFRLAAALHTAAHGGLLQRRLAPSLRSTAEQRKRAVAVRLAMSLPIALGPRALRVKQNVALRSNGVRVSVPAGRAGGALSYSNALLVDTAGSFRHPVFADPRETRMQWDWVSQGAHSGVAWFEKGWQNQAPQFRRGLEHAIENVLEDIVRMAR